MRTLSLIRWNRTQAWEVLNVVQSEERVDRSCQQCRVTQQKKENRLSPILPVSTILYFALALM